MTVRTKSRVSDISLREISSFESSCEILFPTTNLVQNGKLTALDIRAKELWTGMSRSAHQAIVQLSRIMFSHYNRIEKEPECLTINSNYHGLHASFQFPSRRPLREV
jgi:hypothetical protein